MFFKKCFTICISFLAIVMLVQLASARQPSYLDEAEEVVSSDATKGDKMERVRKEIEYEERFERSEEPMLRDKMEQVRKEIDRLNEDLKANIRRLHELEEKLGRRVDDQSRELEESIDHAMNKIEELKRESAPEEEIDRLIRQIEEWKRKLEELYRSEHDFGAQFVPPEIRHSKIMVFRLHHAPADHLAEIIESFLMNGIVRFDMRTNSLIIREIEPNCRNIDMIVHELDQPEGPHPAGPEFMPPERGREIAKVLEVTEEFIVVNFPEHSEWEPLELWIPFREHDDGELYRDKEIVEQVRQFEIGAEIEVEWERYDDDRFWIVWVDHREGEDPDEWVEHREGEDPDEENREFTLRELMKHAMQNVSPEEALERFESVQAHDPECRTPYGKGAQIMIGVNLLKLGKLKEAENAIKAGLELFPEDYRSIWTISGYEALGHIYREYNELDQAIDSYHWAMELYDPDDRDERIIFLQKKVRIKLAEIYVETDRNELAIETLESAIEFGEEIPRADAYAYLMLGELRMNNDDWESAKDKFRKVLDLAEIPEAELDDDVIEKAKVYLEKIEEE